MKENPISKNRSRRFFMKSTGAIISGTALTGTAAAQSSTGLSIEESKVLVEQDDYIIRKTTTNEEVYVTKFYTDGPKQGQMELVELGQASNVSLSEESNGPSLSTNTVGAEAQISASGNVIVTRSKNIGGLTGESCDTNFCSGFTYDHRYGGFTFELNDVVSNFSQAVLGTALANLLVQYTRWGASSNIPSLLAGFLVSSLSGSSFTFIPRDVDKEQWWGAGSLKPKVKHGAAEGWDVHYSDVVVFYTGDQHVNFLDGRCG